MSSEEMLIVLGLVSAIVVLRAARLRFFRPVTHGSAGWGSPPRRFREVPRRGGFAIGHYRGRLISLPSEEASQHGVIIGGSGTGKSRGYFLPNAAMLTETSLVCTDPKGELWRYTSGFHKETLRFAPAEPERSACFNWVSLCGEARIAEL